MKRKKAIVFGHDGVLIEGRSTTHLAKYHNGDPYSIIEKMENFYKEKNINVVELFDRFLKENSIKKVDIGTVGEFITWLRHEGIDNEKIYGRKDTVFWKNYILKELSLEKVYEILNNEEKVKRPRNVEKMIEAAKENGYILAIFSNSIQPSIDTTMKKYKGFDHGKANNVWVKDENGIRPYKDDDLGNGNITITGNVIEIDRVKEIEDFLKMNDIETKNVITIDDTPKDGFGKMVDESGGIFIGFAPKEWLFAEKYGEELRKNGIPVIEEDDMGILAEIIENPKRIKEL